MVACLIIGKCGYEFLHRILGPKMNRRMVCGRSIARPVENMININIVIIMDSIFVIVLVCARLSTLRILNSSLSTFTIWSLHISLFKPPSIQSTLTIITPQSIACSINTSSNKMQYDRLPPYHLLSEEFKLRSGETYVRMSHSCSAVTNHILWW